ncbi:MAG: glutamate 5-kinase [Proteobacteria bacterium]|jgi:glutamate 5-kinase|nr:glutamate 5-kinase [Pseudomonadota bacterium]
MNRSELSQSRRWVVKIGSALLTADGSGVDLALIRRIADQVDTLRQAGIEVVLVSSGAVAAGVSRLGWAQRPDEMSGLQAAAAVGQSSLVQAYESGFAAHDITVAQVLLTHADLANTERCNNARAALGALIELNVVPVINENDTVATEEIRFGDNDNLAALVVELVSADLLVILTDQEGLYDKDPRSNGDALLISEGAVSDKQLKSYAGSSSSLGCGGMITKLEAAEYVARLGVSTVIAGGSLQSVLLKILRGEAVGTFLDAGKRSA